VNIVQLQTANINKILKSAALLTISNVILTTAELSIKNS